MKKVLTTAVATFLLASTLQAAVSTTNPIDIDLTKMNQYFNALVEKHLNSSALNNINYPRTDIQDNSKNIIISFDVAGVKKENMQLSVNDDNVLILTGEKKKTKETKSQNYVKKEIFVGSFRKMVQLPENCKINKLSTSFKDGILTVTIPKKETQAPKAKIIPIK
jgi:HSP20 family protein